MPLKYLGWGAVVAVAMAANVDPAAAEELAVFITAAPPAPRTAEEAKADADQIEALTNQSKELTDSLKKQFGKKDEQWPADKKAELQDLEEQISRREFAYLYSTRSPGDDAKGVESSIAGIKKRLDPNKGVRLVDSTEAADLRIEVLGRRQSTTRGKPSPLHKSWIFDDVVVIGLKVVPAGRLDPALLAKNPLKWPSHSSPEYGIVMAPHQYTAEEPYWWIEAEHAYGPGLGDRISKWRYLDYNTGEALAKVLKEHGAGIAACRQAR